jgi:hypothetical protein
MTVSRDPYFYDHLAEWWPRFSAPVLALVVAGHFVARLPESRRALCGAGPVRVMA